MTQKTNSISTRWIPLVFAAGIVYMLALQLVVSDGAFFSGDGGLNALLAENISAGNFQFDLKFAEPSWARTLWDQGLFPYSQPFVYQLAGKTFITFPYTFPLVTAPFYSLFGYRGLYVVPCLATLGTWLFFYLFTRKLRLRPVSQLIGLLVLIFATNLSVYSAIYWSHALAVFLSFAGLYFFVPREGAAMLRVSDGILGGVFSGLAVWFRPEQIFLVIFLGAISLVSLVKWRYAERLKRISLGRLLDAIGRHGWIYPAACLATLCLYGLTNWLIYHNFFGVHSIQVIEAQSLHSRLATFLGNLRLLTVGYYSLFLYAPVVVLPFLLLIYSWVKPGRVKSEPDWTPWYIFLPFFILGVALLVPAGAGGRQWGPRFLLLLVPTYVLLFSWQLDRLAASISDLLRGVGYVGVGLVVAALVAGIIQNPLRGRDFLAKSYSGSPPILAELRAEGGKVVAASDQYIIQGIQPAVSREMLFFQFEKEDALFDLSEALVNQGLDSFTYLCFSFDCKLFQPDDKSKQLSRDNRGYNLSIDKTVSSGNLTLFSIRISPQH